MPEIPPPIEGEPRVVEASTIKEAVEIATEQIEAGEPVNVVATEEIPEDDATWKKKTQALLNELKALLGEHKNEQTEVRALLTRMDDQLRLAISSSPNRRSENTPNSQTSEPQALPIVAPPETALPSGEGDHREEPAGQPVRKRRKI